MTSLLSARRRAEEFAAAVDGGADGSALRPELSELLGVVGTLRREAQAGAAPAPRPEFSVALRERLMADATTSLAQDTVLALRPRRSGRERRIALVASSLILVGGSAGMAAASQNALPGEALYPIKRGLEKAQTELASSRADQGEDLLAQAETRLVEVRGLFESSDDLTQVPATIDEFTRQSLEGSEVLLKEFETSREETLVVLLRTFAADNLDELRRLAETAAPEHQDELAVAAEAVVRIDGAAESACPSCATELRSLTVPRSFLTAEEAREAIDAAGRVPVDNSHPVLTADREPRSVDGPKPQRRPAAPAAGAGNGVAGAEDVDGSNAPALPGLPSGDVGTSAPEGDLLGDILGGLTGATSGVGDGGKSTDGKTSGAKGDSPSGDTTGSTGDKTTEGDQTDDEISDELDELVGTILP